ncbi:NlpC/P60 family peptidoglycan-binding protein RipD [Mycolicibacterium arenosum]|uniref:NlpC/P60 family peptidoglycan-binding protein RipD n=1 Tax=Mycolicibacterium arenosum TaxID=2952157 RepID=A0ABT1M769_9MYCO|nr:NlpC/P60 family peptidoglycan-binding protein RipD [Mycolicibacterium sp. CAU 1645]MCP9275011.1 NlpC/P60 family peptidoglycan-binding protein RipD [Mycolicibacterium sp. CAU 1645]
MNRIWALVIGLIVSVATVLASAGIASAEPYPRPANHQQLIDVVIKRAVSQQGVPFTYGGGDSSGPTRRPASVPDPATATPLGLEQLPAGAVSTAPGVTAAPGVTPGLGVAPGLGVPAPDPSADVVGFDASGLMVYSFAGVGLKLPRSSGEQYKVGWKVTPDQALPGDLIFYGPDGTQSVALFIGNGQMVETADTGVKVSPVRTNGMAPYLSRLIA